MSTHNICFRREIEKYQYFWIEKSALTRAACMDTSITTLWSGLFQIAGCLVNF